MVKADDLNNVSGQTSYTFGPGDAVTTIEANPDGSLRITKGTYRLDGNTVYFKTASSSKELKLTIGMKEPHLLIGAFGMQMYFKKEEPRPGPRTSPGL